MVIVVAVAGEDDHCTVVYDDDVDGGDHGVCDVHENHVRILRVANKRLVVVHESRHQHHQMAKVHPTMCTVVNVDVDSKQLELVVEMVPNHLDPVAVVNVLCLLY